MWFLLSLCAIFAWSGSDLFSKIGSRPDDRYSHWKMVIAVGGVMGVHAIVQLLGGVSFSLQDIVIYLPASALYIISMIFGYVGLRYIELSISSPICNSSGALVAVMCFLFLGQRMGGMQLVAVALVCIGVISLAVVEKRQDDTVRAARRESLDVKYTRSFKALLFPVLYMVIDALGTFTDAFLLEHYIEETQANIAYELTFLMLAIVAAVYVFIVKRERIAPRADAPKLLAGLCETAGQFAYVFAIGSNAILAAPLIASYSVFSVLWSRIFLKEKLSKQHYATIFLTLAGIVLMGILDM